MQKFFTNHYVKIIISSFISGVLFALCGFELVVAKSINLYYIGGFVQSFALLGCLTLGLKLYNTELCTIFTSKNKGKTLLDIIIIFIVNTLSIFAIGILLRILTNDKPDLVKACKEIADARIISLRDVEGKEWYDALISSIMCGLIVGVGTAIYKRVKSPFGKVLSIVVAVGVYVACGFEQVMTNTFYITYANMFNKSTVLDMFLVFIGNSVTSIFVYFAMKVILPPLPVEGENRNPENQ